MICLTWYVMDGMDGSGKSTAARMLKAELESQGRKVLIMAHPNRGTRLGRAELTFLRKEGKAAMIASTTLYVADVLRSIRHMRGRAARGYDDVIFVRYIMAVAYLPDRLSGLAYRVIAGVLPMPDVAVLVDVDPETAMSRIDSRGEDLEMFETIEKLSAVRRRMLDLSDGWVVLLNDDTEVGLKEQLMSNVWGKNI